MLTGIPLKPGLYKCPSSFTKEKDFTTWYNKQVASDAFIYKISDESRVYKPFDCFCMKNGKGFAIELKITKSMSCKAYSLLSGSSPSKPGTQVANLTKRQNNGGISLVVIYNTINKNFLVVDFKDLSPNTIVSLCDQET